MSTTIVCFQRSFAPNWIDAGSSRDGDAGHARWQAESATEDSSVIPRGEVLSLGWGEEYDVVTFLADQAEATAQVMFPDRMLRPARPAEREGLGKNQADLMFHFTDGSVGLLEAKGTKPTNNQRFSSTGEQLVSYARASPIVSHIAVAVGIGVYDGRRRLPSYYDPEGWWAGATRSSRYKRHSAMLMRIRPDRIALIVDDEPHGLKQLLSSRYAVDPHESILTDWVAQLRLTRASKHLDRTEQPGPTHLRSHRIHLGTSAVHAETSTPIRWYLRIFEDHVWIYFQYEPDEALTAQTKEGWQCFKGGASAHYTIHRKHVGALSDMRSSDISQLLAQHLPPSIMKALRLK